MNRGSMLGLETVVNALFFIWFLVLTFFLFRFYFSYSKLIKNGKKESLVEILDAVLDNEKQISKQLREIEKRSTMLERDKSFTIQKLGLLRFNPFNDTGGDQSFILALLDAHDSGIMVSSLHTRTGTRWYAKRVAKGKGIEYDLSGDEQRALKEARPLSQ